MQQKPLTRPPHAAGAPITYDSMASSVEEYSDSSTLSDPSSIAPLRSVLKKCGRRSRGFRVSINESLNQVVESDYVILLQENEQPQLVSMKALDLTNLSNVPAGIDIVTLSPPEGYKDCFGRSLNDQLNDDSDNECDDARKDWILQSHDPYCPHSSLPDLLSPNNLTSSSSIASRFHSKHIKPLENHKKCDTTDYQSVMTGILKGGKLWKSGDKNYSRYEIDKERSVRFSERDEYNFEETFSRLNDLQTYNSHGDIIIHSGIPQMNPNLTQNSQDWRLDLEDVNLQKLEDNSLHFADNGQFSVTHTCPKHGKYLNEQTFEEEHIKESIQRYEEMRRRLSLAETRDNASVEQSKEFISKQISDLSNAESRIRRIENSEAAHVAGTVMRSNNEVRRAIESNALRRSLIRFSEARKKDSNKNDKSEKHETSLIEKLKWLTTEDATNGNAYKRKNESNEEKSDEGKSKEMNREESLIFQTIGKYRKLAEMFNKSTSSRVTGYEPESKDWNKDDDKLSVEPESISEIGEDLSVILNYVPPSNTEQTNDEDADKLIYSGGVRYTKEGTLPHIRKSASKCASNQPKTLVNGCCPDNDEGIPEDKSSSITSSQSSPRYATKDESEVVSTTESGYSSNELSSQTSPRDTKDVQVRSDVSRKNGLENCVAHTQDVDDHGFSRRPSVRGVKIRQNSFNKDFQTQRNSICSHPTKLSISKCNHVEHSSQLVAEELIGTKNASIHQSNKSELSHALESQRSPYVQVEYDGLTLQNATNQLSFNGSSFENQPSILDRESSHQRVQLNPQLYQTQHFNNISQIMGSPGDLMASTGIEEASNSTSGFHRHSTQEQSQFQSISYEPSYVSHPHCEFQHMELVFQDNSRNMQVPYEDLEEHHFQTHKCAHDIKPPAKFTHQISQESLSPCGNHIFSQSNSKLSPLQHSSTIPALPNDSRKVISCVHNKKELLSQYSDKQLPSNWHQQGHGFNHNSMSGLPPTIISSHNSYTTPILPDGAIDTSTCLPLIRGVMSSEEMKYSLELNNCIYKATDALISDLSLKPLAMNNIN